jgi:hypothetical protein
MGGLALYQYFYSEPELQQLKAAAAPPATWSLAGYDHTLTSAGPCPDATAQCPSGYSDFIWVPNQGGYTGPGCALYSGDSSYLYPGPPEGYQYPVGWSTWQGRSGYQGCFSFRPNANTGPRPVSSQQPVTQTDIQNYLTNAAPTHALSLDANAQPLGVGVTPEGATNTTTTPVTTTDIHSTVVPVSSVTSTDAVLNPNEPVPSGTQTQTQQQTASTTTTTTTTNPDGSTTDTETSEATVSCAAGSHDSRNLGSVLAEHLERWQGSALLGTLQTLKTLAWPSTLPTYTLESALLGTFSFDFSAWSGTLLALRTIVIAAASFVAYRIVFVGAR